MTRISVAVGIAASRRREANLDWPRKAGSSSRLAAICNDCAATKRSELLKRGWPAPAALLSEVITKSGEHHLVLVIRTREGDLVLDNLAPRTSAWSRTPYRWLRIQLPDHDRLWATVADRGAQDSL